MSEVFKGDVAPTQPIVSAVSTATCGIGLPLQGEFFVFASRRDLVGQPTGEYYANLCGGTRSTAAGPLEVPSLAPPTTVAPPPVTTAPEPEPTTSTVPAPVTTVAVAVAVAVAVTVPVVLEGAAIGDASPVSASDDAGGIPVGLVAVVLGALLAVGGAGVFGVRRGR